MDVRVTWLRFGLTVAGCAIGGLALGYLATAVVVEKILNGR